MKATPSRRCTYVAAIALATMLPIAACGARENAPSNFPQRSIQVIVPYPAGSGIDTTTRALADIINEGDALSEDLQIVNRDGGGGSVGTTEILQAKADGYTIGVVPDGPLTLVPQVEEIAYDPDALTMIDEVIESPIIFVVPEASPYQNLQDLIDAAKDEPSSITIGEGPLNYAIPATEFEQKAGVKLKHIDFDGDQATTTALLGDNVDVGVMQLASALPQLKSGKIRALGVTAAKPVDLVPDVETFASQGVDIDWSAYNMVIAPDGVPDDVVEDLEGAFSDAIDSDEFADAAEKLGLIVSGIGPDDATQHLRDKTEASTPILETLG
ncbi:tripartite tricarboxylate transporter substrate binding protein [Nocardioidaceae bacterium SCSIO 66511]|nr:tripartite tricarboxylate transporter substrate binding protein [Nocardioidaceae bacterium SCSIO 66511]